MAGRPKLNGRRFNICSSINIGSDYTDEEREFMAAMDRFKRDHHKPFPTCRDVLAVIWSLGYRRLASPEGRDGVSLPGVEARYHERT